MMDSFVTAFIPVMGVFSLLWENAFALSIFFIFASALLGFFIKARSVDKCLRDFAGYAVAIATSKDTHRGVMKIYPTGMELEYKLPAPASFPQYSYVFYSSEYPTLKAVYRYQDELTEENKNKRAYSIRRTYQPSLIRRLWRKLRNILGTFRDAFTQSLHLLVGQAKKAHPGSQVWQNQDKHFKDMSKDLVEYTGNIYDPILEKFIGRKVVVETLDDGVLYYGIFKEYSQGFIELLNVELHREFAYQIHDSTENADNSSGNPSLLVSQTKKKVTIKNISTTSACIAKVKSSVFDEVTLATLLPPGQETNLIKKDLVENPKETAIVEVAVTTVQFADIIFPRSRAIIRHNADQENDDWTQALKTDIQSLWQASVARVYDP